jgi:hypothetical protein
MARPNSPTSFSAGRRWGIFFSVLVSIAAVAALVLMLNYLGARHFLRFSWSAKTSLKLSPPTLSLLNSITNDVKVTLYYDKQDALYSDVADLLNEYHLANPKISVHTVDYQVDPTSALQTKATYGLASSEDKNLLIFECNHQVSIISGELLANYSVEQLAPEASSDGQDASKRRFERHVREFDGEAIVDAKLISVIGPPFHAYYLTGNGEPSLDGRANFDYSGFAEALSNSHIQTTSLSLAGTNAIPPDCNLLIIAGPRYPIGTGELEKIRQYLAEGGRLFVLFNFKTVSPEPITTGLEAILADWGVNVGMNIITDPDNTANGQGLAVMNFNTNHACVGPLVGSRLLLFPPRSISTNAVPASQGQDPPSVAALAWTGPRAVVDSQLPAGGPVPLIVAVEKKNVKGVLQRGTTRIIVAGDSFFLSNPYIQAEANGAFAELAARWLLEQTQLMNGVPPRKVVEYKVTMTRAQMSAIRWIFRGAMPGGILLLGGLVWLRRRH